MLKRLLCLLLAATALAAAAGCGGKQEGGEETGGVYTVSDFTLPDAEYGEFYKFDTSGVTVLDEEGNETDLTLGVQTVEWPSGKETRVAGTSLKLNEVGDYTVNFVIRGTDQTVSKQLVCKDTKGPAIALGESVLLPQTAVIGQKVLLPDEPTASDLSGVDEKVALKVIRPDGKEAAVENGRFTAETAGEYLLEYSVHDNNGNLGTRTETVTVYDVQKEEGVVGYTHIPYGIEQNDGMYKHETYIEEVFVADVTQPLERTENGVAIAAGEIPALPDGSVSATLITPSDDVQRMTYRISSAIDDMTSYDYVGMWLYNDNPLGKDVRVSLNYRGANEFTVRAGKWCYVAFNLNAFDYSDKAVCAYNDTGTPVYQTRDGIRHVTFRFDYVWDESEYFADDDYGYREKGYADLDFDLYIGKITAGTADAVGAFDKYYGTAFYTDYTADEYPVTADSRFEYTQADGMKEAGTDGATVIESIAAAESLPLHLYMFKGAEVGAKYAIWVKNPNAYSIVFDDGNGNKTVLSAGEEKLVPVTLYETDAEEWGGAGLYNAEIKAESGELPAGAKVCLGALRKA